MVVPVAVLSASLTNLAGQMRMGLNIILSICMIETSVLATVLFADIRNCPKRKNDRSGCMFVKKNGSKHSKFEKVTPDQ